MTVISARNLTISDTLSSLNFVRTSATLALPIADDDYTIRQRLARSAGAPFNTGQNELAGTARHPYTEFLHTASQPNVKKGD